MWVWVLAPWLTVHGSVGVWQEVAAYFSRKLDGGEGSTIDQPETYHPLITTPHTVRYFNLQVGDWYTIYRFKCSLLYNTMMRPLGTPPTLLTGLHDHHAGGGVAHGQRLPGA